MNIEGLDQMDQTILKVIRDNARMSYSDIGAIVGLSRVAVRKRMEALEKKGIIQGYKTVIDETKVPEGISFILDIEAVPEEYQNVAEVLTRDRFLRKIYSTTGECRLHCQGFAPNHRTLESHVNHLFRSTKGIRKMGWHMLLSTIKDIDGGVEYEQKQGSTGADDQ
ncbi:MAG: Lrp/AsnC family transcriptional regulator [Bariatricus sp.]